MSFVDPDAKPGSERLRQRHGAWRHPGASRGSKSKAAALTTEPTLNAETDLRFLVWLH